WGQEWRHREATPRLLHRLATLRSWDFHVCPPAWKPGESRRDGAVPARACDRSSARSGRGADRPGSTSGVDSKRAAGYSLDIGRLESHPPAPGASSARAPTRPVADGRNASHSRIGVQEPQRVLLPIRTSYRLDVPTPLRQAPL